MSVPDDICDAIPQCKEAIHSFVCTLAERKGRHAFSHPEAYFSPAGQGGQGIYNA